MVKKYSFIIDDKTKKGLNQKIGDVLIFEGTGNTKIEKQLKNMNIIFLFPEQLSQRLTSYFTCNQINKH